VVVLWIVFPVGREYGSVQAERGEAETLACEEELLPLLEWAGITFISSSRLIVMSGIIGFGE